MAYCLKHSSHFPIPPFRQCNFVPAVSPLTATRLDRSKLGVAVIQRDPFKQSFFFFVIQGTQHPNSIFALETKARMHQSVGEFARAGEQQQTFGIKV